jgi:hypothetical protein
MEIKAQNDHICVTQVEIISRPAAAQIGGYARVLPDLLHHSV